jgi:hypothetical protein
VVAIGQSLKMKIQSETVGGVPGKWEAVDACLLKNLAGPAIRSSKRCNEKILRRQGYGGGGGS